MDIYNYSAPSSSIGNLSGLIAPVGQSIDTLYSSHSPTNVTDKSSDQLFYEKAKEITGLYLFPVICTLGITGNILTFMVFIKIKPRSSTTVFLSTLAISDTIKLLCDILYFVVVYLEKIGFTKISHNVYVNLYPYAHYILNFSLCNTAWLTVAVAIERYIFMKWPERVRSICTVTRATITCCIIWLCSMLVAVPFLLRYKRYITDDGVMEITVSPLWEIDEFTDGYVWVQNILRTIIPLIILVILNTWIIRALGRLSKRHMEAPPCKIRATSMLVAMIIAFLVCITPDAILSAAFGFGYTDAPYMIRGIRECSDVLLCINSAVNFFLYFAFNKIFRMKLAKLCCCDRYLCFKSDRSREWLPVKNPHEGIT